MANTNTSFIRYFSEKRLLVCLGEWTVEHISQLKIELKKITLPISGEFTIDGQDISKMDTAGAWLIDTALKKARERKVTIHLENFSQHHKKLLALIEKEISQQKHLPIVTQPNALAVLGKNTILYVQGFYEYLHFIGELAIETLRLFGAQARMRWSDFASVIQRAGFQALPIIALLSFMIGIVISYQMGNQLRKYGANVFIVDLMGFSVLREFGPLLAAIMVAGRTGSAFTAQLGMMKINQEIDALNIMGVTPANLLVLPRIFALFLVMPLLTMWADIFGILGGIMMANNMLGVTWNEFLARFQAEIPLRALLIGLGKAPVFALLIGSIGCFQGMQVRGSADSVGKRTTRSVVLAIFFIIVVDGIFSIIFSKLKL